MADRRLNFDITAANKTSRAFAQLNRSLDRTDKGFKAIRRTVTGLAAVGAVAGLARLTKGALDTADAIAKQADAIGLSTDALQEYRVAAGLSGVSTETLDASFARLGKRLGELRQGSGALYSALRRSDPALLRQLQVVESTDEALDLMFRSLSDVTDASDRAALAAAAFGREGVAMVNMLREGNEGLEAMRGRARALGLVIEEDLLRGAERANDELSLLWQVLSTRLTVALLKLAPLLERISRTMLDWATWLGRTEVDKEVEKAAAEVEMWNAAIRDATDQGLPHKDLLVGLANAERALADALERQAAARAANNQTLEVEITRGKLAEETLERQIQGWRQYYYLRREGEALRNRKDEAEETEKNTQALGRQNDELRQLGSIGRQAFGGLIKGTDDWREALGRALERLSDLAFDKAWDALFENVFNMSGGGGGGGFGGIFSLFSGLGGFFGGGGAGIKGPIPGKNFLAGGGPAQAGQSYVVGEEGPELFVPRVSGTVVPNGAAGGFTFAPVIDARGADMAAIARLERVLAEQAASFRKRVIGVVEDERGRNPGFMSA